MLLKLVIAALVSASGAALAQADDPTSAPLSWRLEAGQTLYYENVAVTTTRSEASPEATLTRHRWIEMRVVSVADGVATIDLTTRAARTESPNVWTDPIEVTVVDSWGGSPMPRDTSVDGFWDHASVGQTIRLRLRADGTVLDAHAPDSLAAADARFAELRAQSGLSEALTDEERAELAAARERSLSVSRLQALFPLLSGVTFAEQPTWSREQTRDSLFGGQLQLAETHSAIPAGGEAGLFLVGVETVPEFVFPPGVDAFLTIDRVAISGGYVFDTNLGTLTSSSSTFETSTTIRPPDSPQMPARQMNATMTWTWERVDALEW